MLCLDVFQQLGQISISIPQPVLQHGTKLGTDHRDSWRRLPSHAERRYVPIGSPWHTRGRVVLVSMAHGTTRDRRTMIIRPTNDAVNVGVADVGLTRVIAERMAIDAARAREDGVDRL